MFAIRGTGYTEEEICF